MGKRRRHRLKRGDIFAVPLHDGYFGLAQIGVISCGVWTYVVFDAHVESVEAMRDALEATLKRPVAMAMISPGDSASSGLWPFIVNREPAFSFAVPAYQHQPGATSSSDHFIDALCNSLAGTGLRNMTRSAFAPYLVPGAQLPSLRDGANLPLLVHPPLPRDRLKPPAPGPTRAVVTMAYEVDAPPSVLVLRRRQAFVDDVIGEGLGEVIEQRGGHGIVEVVIDVPDGARAHKPLLKLLRHNGFEWSFIEYAAFSSGSAG